MSTLSAEPSKYLQLRVDAEARLDEGSAPPTNGWTVSVGALTRLHNLASAPESVDDALKLLHELQVYQVELDLQHEQMEATRRELAEDLARLTLRARERARGKQRHQCQHDYLESHPTS